MPKTHSNNSNKGALRAEFDRAVILNRRGKKHQAARLLERLAQQHPRSGAIVGYLGGVYFELDQPAKALKHFRRAIELSPKSELASLGLFHCLWSLQRFTEAFDEMRRFLSIAHSVEYTTVLRDLAVEGRLAPVLEVSAT